MTSFIYVQYWTATSIYLSVFIWVIAGTSPVQVSRMSKTTQQMHYNFGKWDLHRTSGVPSWGWDNHTIVKDGNFQACEWSLSLIKRVLWHKWREHRPSSRQMKSRKRNSKLAVLFSVIGCKILALLRSLVHISELPEDMSFEQLVMILKQNLS